LNIADIPSLSGETGLALIPIKKDDKRPLLNTGGLEKIFDTGMFDPAYSSLKKGLVGLGLAGGHAGVEVIDIEKAAVNESIQRELVALILCELGEDFYDSLVLTNTRSGGRHIIYRFGDKNELPGKPLAKKANGDLYIETRGYRQYVVVPPSKGYGFIQGDLHSIPLITLEQRNKLLELCQRFHEGAELPQHPKVTGNQSWREPGGIMSQLLLPQNISQSSHYCLRKDMRKPRMKGKEHCGGDLIKRMKDTG